MLFTLLNEKFSHKVPFRIIVSRIYNTFIIGIISSDLVQN